MSQRRIRLKLRTPFLVFLLYILISGLLLGFSSGGFVINFKKLGFSIISSVQKGISTVTNGVTSFFTAMGDLASLRTEYEILQNARRHISLFPHTFCRAKAWKWVQGKPWTLPIYSIYRAWIKNFYFFKKRYWQIKILLL